MQLGEPQAGKIHNFFDVSNCVCMQQFCHLQDNLVTWLISHQVCHKLFRTCWQDGTRRANTTFDGFFTNFIQEIWFLCVCELIQSASLDHACMYVFDLNVPIITGEYKYKHDELIPAETSCSTYVLIPKFFYKISVVNMSIYMKFTFLWW